MKKIILFSLMSIIYTTIKADLTLWKTVRTIVKMFDNKGHRGAIVRLSTNATWEEFHKEQNKAINLALLGDEIAKAYEKKPENYHLKLLEIATKEYIETLLKQNDLAQHTYNRDEDQTAFLSLINELRTLQQKSQE